MNAEIGAWREQVCSCENVQLLAEMQRLVRVGRRCEVRVLVWLAEVDARESYLGLGFSLFVYATSALGMSGAEAYLRIQAARAGRRFPLVLEMLAQGALTLSTVKLLDRHLTDDNHLSLLEQARDKTTQEVALLVAELAPKPDVPTRMRKLPAPAARREVSLDEQTLSDGGARSLFMSRDGQGASASQPAAMSLQTQVMPANAAAQVAHAAQVGRASVGRDAQQVQPAAAAATGFALEAPRASCTVLRPGRYKLELTASQSLHDKLRQLQHLLQHQVPGGDLAVIVELAADMLLDKKRKQRFAQPSVRRSSAKIDVPAVSTDLGAPLFEARSSALVDAPAVNTDLGVPLLDAGSSALVDPPAVTAHSAGPLLDAGSSALVDPPAVTAHSAGPLLDAGSSALVERRVVSTTLIARRSGLGNHAPRTKTSAAKPRSRYIPRAVRREVFARDGYQCSFVSADGRRCCEPGMLELDHRRAFVLGGLSTVENLRVVCRAHNQFFAVQDFGASHMRAKRTFSAGRRLSPRLFNSAHNE